jgi:hypothetical protein
LPPSAGSPGGDAVTAQRVPSLPRHLHRRRSAGQTASQPRRPKATWAAHALPAHGGGGSQVRR